MAFSVEYTQHGLKTPYWHLLDVWADREEALRRARNYALDHGGYVCVKDGFGNVIYGTDPKGLERAISLGINHDFTAA